MCSDAVELLPSNAVARYGQGDCVLKLSVSGTKFLTLRSTLAHSPVLHEIVQQAENNEELKDVLERFELIFTDFPWFSMGLDGCADVFEALNDGGFIHLAQ